jgi:hypothetical protein
MEDDLKKKKWKRTSKKNRPNFFQCHFTFYFFRSSLIFLMSSSIFGMQPYFDPNRKTTSKKKLESTSKKI